MKKLTFSCTSHLPFKLQVFSLSRFRVFCVVACVLGTTLASAAGAQEKTQAAASASTGTKASTSAAQGGSASVKSPASKEPAARLKKEPSPPKSAVASQEASKKATAKKDVGKAKAAPAKKPKPPQGNVKSLKAGSATPWADGVSLAKQKEANDMLLAGNELMREGLFNQAIEKYKKVLEIWDHPGVHYNLSLAYLALDESIKTYRHLTEATKYGEDALEKDKYLYAEKYLTLLGKQVMHLQVICNEPGAEVRLDGKFLFRAPGGYEGLLLRGEHTVVARKPGMLNTEIQRNFDQERVTLELKLYREDELIEYKRRYPLWIPLTVTAAGLAIAGGSYLGTQLAINNYNNFDDKIANNPECELGCVPNDSAQNSRNAGDRWETIGVIGYAVGGAVFATGVTLLVLDKKEGTRVTPEEKQGFAFTPLIGPNGAGIVGSGHF